MYVGKRVTLCINNLRVENYHLPSLVYTTSGVEEQAQIWVPAAVNTTATPGKASSSLCPKKAV